MQDALTRLETERLVLRPFEEGDYPLVYAISSDPATTKYLYFWGRVGWTPETDARRFLDYALKNWKKCPIRAREYCVVRKDTGEKIGDGSVEWVEDEEGTAEIGWILLPAHRGQGFATEMGRELCRAGFEIMGAQRIIAHCDDRNAPSWHVMERLGMRFAALEKGVRPEKRVGDPKGDERTYEITRAEWTKTKKVESSGKAVRHMKIIHTENAPAAIGPYSQAIAVNGFVYTSGQIAIDPATGAIGESTIEGQAEQAIRNLDAVLTAAGSDLTRVVKTTCFLRHMSDFAAFNAVYARYFSGNPARSCVEVSALPKDALVEIECVAVMKEA